MYIRLIVIVQGILFGVYLNAQTQEQLIVQLDEQLEMLYANHDTIYLSGLKTILIPVKQLSKSLNIWLCELDDSVSILSGKALKSKKELLLDICQTPGIKTVQYNDAFSFRAIPNDHLFTRQWQYQNNGYINGSLDVDIDAPEAWEITTGGKTVSNDEIVVAVIDGGINQKHPDLAENIWENRGEIPQNGIDDDHNGYIDDIFGWNFNNGTNDIGNQKLGHWHGSAVAGIIGACGNNNIGVSGVNWNVKIMSLIANKKIADIIIAYDYVLEMRSKYNKTGGREGAFIVATNASLGVDKGKPEDSPLWCMMYDALGREGVISVVAAANDNINVDIEGDLPTSCSSQYLISVTNTTSRDIKDVYAAYGAVNVDIGAPGLDVFTVSNDIGYDFFSGTSAATPHVTGAVALLYSINSDDFISDVRNNPARAALLVKDFIMKGNDAVQSLQNISVTGGRLNLYKSILEMQYYYDIHSVNNPLNNSLVGYYSIYPNPAHKVVYLDFELSVSTEIEVGIFDALGQKIRGRELGFIDAGIHQAGLPLDGFEKGMYFIKINENKTVKFLVE